MSIDLNSWFDLLRYDLLLLTYWMIMQQSNAIDLIASSKYMRILITINRSFLMSIDQNSWEYWLLLIEIFSWVLIRIHEDTDYY